MGVRRVSGVELWSGGQNVRLLRLVHHANVDAGKVGNVGLGWNLSQTWSNLEYTHWGKHDMVGMYSRGLSPQRLHRCRLIRTSSLGASMRSLSLRFW